MRLLQLALGIVVAVDGSPESRVAVDWAARGAELGVGEILLNSMDADGTKAGFDLAMLRAVRGAVTVPVIASGGVGRV